MVNPADDRRVVRTRMRLREALLALMAEQTYEQITVQQIIDRADVARATFYSHYRDKDDLLLRGVAHLTQSAAGEALTRAGEAGAFSTTHMFYHSRANERLHQVMFKRNSENYIQEQVTALLRDGVAARLSQMAGERQSPVPLPILTHFVTGGLLALLRWWHANGFPYTPEEMDAFFQQFAMPGVENALTGEHAAVTETAPHVGGKHRAGHTAS